MIVYIGPIRCGFAVRLSDTVVICPRYTYSGQGQNNTVRVLVRGDASTDMNVRVDYAQGVLFLPPPPSDASP